MESWKEELYHHGIKNQRWGVRNGPPYPLKGSQFSSAELAVKKKRSKKSEDHVIKSGTTLNTLSHDPDRTKDAKMFYAAHTKGDKNIYMSLLNDKISKDIVDPETGEKIGSAQCYKYMINNTAKSDINVAGEDQSIQMFENLFKNDRDFSNFVTDKDRMQKYFEEAHANKSRNFYTKPYKEAFNALDKLEGRESKLSESDMRLLYRVFNYTIPYDGTHNSSGPDTRGGHDVEVQRAKFFKEAKKNGYGAILDSNDAQYGSYRHVANKPVIVFDMEQVIPDKVWQTKMSDKVVADLVAEMKLTTLKQVLS